MAVMILARCTGCQQIRNTPNYFILSHTVGRRRCGGEWHVADWPTERVGHRLVHVQPKHACRG